jgi:hypothetical protein
MSIVLLGSTSGSVTLQEQAVAGTSVLTLPVGTGTVVANNVNSAIVNSTAVTAATGSPTSIDFTSIPSWAKKVTIMCAGISYNATATPMIQLGTSGGIDSTSNYVGSAISASTGTTAESALNTVGFNIAPSTAASTNYSLTVTLSLLDASTNQWICAVSGSRNETAGGILGGGNKTLSATLDRVRITTLAGTATFDAGTINILYE